MLKFRIALIVFGLCSVFVSNGFTSLYKVLEDPRSSDKVLEDSRSPGKKIVFHGAVPQSIEDLNEVSGAFGTYATTFGFVEGSPKSVDVKGRFSAYNIRVTFENGTLYEAFLEEPMTNKSLALVNQLHTGKINLTYDDYSVFNLFSPQNYQSCLEEHLGLTNGRPAKFRPLSSGPSNGLVSIFATQKAPVGTYMFRYDVGASLVVTNQKKVWEVEPVDGGGTYDIGEEFKITLDKTFEKCTSISQVIFDVTAEAKL